MNILGSASLVKACGLVLLLGVAISGQGVRAQVHSCDALGWSSNTVYKEPKIDRSLSAKALRAYAEKLPIHSGGQGSRVALYEPESTVSVELRWGTQGSTQNISFICVESIVYRSVLEPVVHIASEVPEGSCADRVVLADVKSRHVYAKEIYAASAERSASNQPWPTVPFTGAQGLQARASATLYASSYANKMTTDSAVLFVRKAEELNSMLEHGEASRECGTQSLSTILDKVVPY